jgi:hypothetical protein
MLRAENTKDGRFLGESDWRTETRSCLKCGLWLLPGEIAITYPKEHYHVHADGTRHFLRAAFRLWG